MTALYFLLIFPLDWENISNKKALRIECETNKIIKMIEETNGVRIKYKISEPKSYNN